MSPDLRQAREELAQGPPDVIFMDLNLPDGSGLDLIAAAGVNGHLPETIMITGQASMETAVEALRNGVSDYLTKPVDFARVKMILANVSRARELKEEIGTLRGELRKLGRFGGLIGASPAIQKVYDLLAKIARSDATVLITGETGSGKEILAQTIHQMSRRAREVFLPLNCGAVSPTLIESELFGHERGSFTGADRVHKGYFERANRGTLFLDEITETPLELQVKLLRVLETSTVMRVGGTETLRTNVRVIAATNRRPEQAVAGRQVREDPPLSAQRVPHPHAHAVGAARGHRAPSPSASSTSSTSRRARPRSSAGPPVERLKTHRWPGNVRELRNVIQRAFIMADEHIGIDTLPLGVSEAAGGASGLHLRVGTSIAEAERRLVLATLEYSEGDKKKAAETLGISLKTLYNKINQYRGGP